MNARRRSASSHSVNSSSNWSTTTSRSGSSSASITGAGPGVSSVASPQPVDLARRARRRRRRRAGPRTCRCPTRRRRRAAGRARAARWPPRRRLRGRRRRGDRPGSNASRPRYGHSPADGDVQTPGPASAWMRSGVATPSRRCGPRSTSEQASGRCAATSSLVSAESRISPPSAAARTRTARFTLGPKYSPSRRSAAPVWMPQRAAIRIPAATPRPPVSGWRRARPRPPPGPSRTPRRSSRPRPST